VRRELRSWALILGGHDCGHQRRKPQTAQRDVETVDDENPALSQVF